MIAVASYEFGTKNEAVKLLNLKNPDSVKHYHKRWIDGIHFYKRPGGRRTGYNYNLTLIRHWIQCHEDVNHPNHIRAMASGRNTHWADILANNLIKQITPKATALLQSFPESYPLPESKTLAQQIIGNAVPPMLAKELGLAILKSIN